MAASRPATSRCAAWAVCRGRISGVVSEARIGTPSSTMSPSSTDVDRRMNETTIHDTMAPEKRASTSKAPPILMASAATVFTTSPAGISSVRAAPVEEMWRPMSWIVR